jgi:hypothetical protein
MTRDFQPGDVAMVTWSALGQPITEPRFRIDDERGARWIGADGSWIGDFTAKDARPLAVIDPEDREQVARLCALFLKGNDGTAIGGVNDLQAALREFANPTLRIEEPVGLGAVVEDSEGWRWTRTLGKEPAHRRYWIACTGSFQQVREWGDLDVVRILSEGVTS